MKIRHLNCGILQAPGGPAAACHCLLLEWGPRLVLVDTGVGPRERVDDDGQRRHSLAELRRLASDHPEVELLGYHDFSELPPC